jgi:hypothetical protein
VQNGETDHGAKNSTRIKGSESTEDLKVDAVRLRTSDSASVARTTEVKASTELSKE